MPLNIQTLFILSLLLNSLVYFLGEWIAKKLKGNDKMIKLGDRLFNSKKKMADRALFQYIFKKLKSGKPFFPQLLLCLMIFLKASGMFISGLFLFGPMILLFQGITMGALKARLDQDDVHKDFRNIVFVQLSGHVLSISLGLALGVKWIIEGYKLSDLLSFNDPSLIITSLLILVSAIITAKLESKMIQKKGISLLS